MSIDLSQFLPTFFEESFEGIEIMESTLLSLDSDDKEAIDSIFRAAHSIKGSAGTFGLTMVSEFTHHVETMLDELRDGRRKFSDHDKELLLKATDVIKALLVEAKDGIQPNDVDITEVTKALEFTLANGNEDKTSLPGWHITFIPEQHVAQTGNDPKFLFNALADLGTLDIECILENLPGYEQLDVEELYLSWDIRLTNTQASKKDILEVFEWVEDECVLNINAICDETMIAEVKAVPDNIEKNVSIDEKVMSTEKSKDNSPPEKINDKQEIKNTKAKTETSSIRVGVDKVDSLINLVGELVITQSMLSELGQSFDETKVEQLTAGLEQLLQNTKELQESVMRIRMLPISFTFNRFPRLVHDLAKKMDKKINLSIQGENTELDKTVLERISDPLTHLVRNAIDHGIEPAEDRIAAGKAEIGEITLKAYHLGGNVVIEIQDDGRGIDKQAILNKAREKQLIDNNYPINEQQIYDLIFEPGFSTAKEVSDISGRGVGMDVVKRNIQSLGGRIVIDSNLGKGSTIKVSLPLTLAILDGQLISVSGETYVIPLLVIVESLQIQTEHIVKASGNQVFYRLREDNVPIIPIGGLFGLTESNNDLTNALLIVVESEGEKVGLLVDDLLGQQQVVIKSLQDNYQQVIGISGATILGNGAVALILDVAGVISLARKQTVKSSMPVKMEANV